jgi:nicotinamidase-related amidase
MSQRNPSKYETAIPPHFNPNKVGEVWRVNYSGLAPVAQQWAAEHNIKAAVTDRKRICLMPIDVQNTFCIPDFELYVGGQSGTGAIDDNRRLAEFTYRYLSVLTAITPTLDTHTAMQIFHPFFWINEKGEHPIGGATFISLEDVQKGVWRVNPAVVFSVTGNKDMYTALQAHALHYTKRLSEDGKYALMIWPYHAMLGGIGHALVSSCEEAFFFHNIARRNQTGFEIKGGNPLTENYSVLRPEVLDGPSGAPIASKNSAFFKKLLDFDAIIIGGQAKSHCVAWTIDDLLNEINAKDPRLAQKVYLLEDCTSPVVLPGIIDFTDMANAAFDRFRDAGMHVVRSTDPIEEWPGMNL